MVVDKSSRPAADTGAGAKPKPKEKRRNNEKRKEKSRDAARTRRSRETEIFADLGEALPLSKEDVDQLDKASVMRLAIAYLKVRDMVDTVFPKGIIDEVPQEDVKPSQELSFGSETEQMLIDVLDGFLFVLSEDGDITYVSEKITDILGLQQIDILSQPIWDYAHQCDHEELRNVLKQKGAKGTTEDAKSADMFLRLKCTLTSRGRNVNIKSASFKVIHVKGHVVVNEETNKKLLVAIGRPIPHPSNIEVPLGSKMFLTKHSLDMKFSYVDEKLTSLLNYEASALMGKSLFDYHHGSDSEYLSGAFKCLLSKGQMETKKYRFLGAGGGYAWIVTQATVVMDKQKPQSVVCVNYLISGIENEHEVYSIAQLEARTSLTKELARGCEVEHNKQLSLSNEQKTLKNNNSGQQQPKVQKNPKSVRICEPPKQSGPRGAVPCFTSPPGGAVPIQVQIAVPLGSSSCALNAASVNRPRSVTDALFAAAPEVAPANPTAPVAAPAQSSSSIQNQHLPQTSAEDMNKGFLPFADEDPDLIMLKEEVDDLSHLAPTPGDACIPLDEPTSSFLASYEEELNDLIDNYIYGDGGNSFEAATSAVPGQTDSYFAEPPKGSQLGGGVEEMTPSHKPLLKDAIISENVFAAAGLTVGSVASHMNEMMCDAGVAVAHEKRMDPFITYRDESSDASVATSHLLSPDDCSTQSPDRSLPSSLCSPSDSYADDDLAFMTSIKMEDDMDMSMRAPYISMSEADDLPLLISEDLMWGALPCDGPKFQGEPRLNVVVDVASMQVASANQEMIGQALASAKAGDFLLSNGNGLATGLLTTVRDGDLPLMMLEQHHQQQLSHRHQTPQSLPNNRRRKSAMMLAGAEEEDEEEVQGRKVIGMVMLKQESGSHNNGTSSSSCSSEDTNQSVDMLFDYSMTKNCSTPPSDINTWSSFNDFMAMDSGSQLDAGLYSNSSECSSPFTASNSSLDSIGAHGRRKHRKVESVVVVAQQRQEQVASHKRSLSNSNAGGMGLKEMLCATNLRNEASQQAKRIKCEDRMTTSPQLLQQLMAPSKQTHNSQGKSSSSSRKEKVSPVGEELESSSNRSEVKGFLDSNGKKKESQQATAPSNSVLMNLLSPLHIEAPPDINEEDEDMAMLMSALSNSPNIVLRSNPLIGGDQQLTPNSSENSMFMDTSEYNEDSSMMCFSSSLSLSAAGGVGGQF